MNYTAIANIRQAYMQELERLVPAVVSTLHAREIQARYLVFGTTGEVSLRKPFVPTDARSEFLANRSMGDWAEDVLKAGILSADDTVSVSHYGDTGSMVAGAPGFREMYLDGLEETRVRGKRPDLLVFSKVQNVAPNLNSLPDIERTRLAKTAIGAIEVRSSKFEALKYIAVRKADREAGKKAARDTPSFTVKVEDLKIVYRWLKNFSVPQIYAQVFFDSIFAINFLTIISAIIEGAYIIDSPKKSQEKATIMIPITVGRKIGTATSIPDFAAVHEVNRLGRHDAYVKPTGGGFKVDPVALESTLYEWSFSRRTIEELLAL
jgi:hypothetical protein